MSGPVPYALPETLPQTGVAQLLPSWAYAMEGWIYDRLPGRSRTQHVASRLIHLTWMTEEGPAVRHPRKLWRPPTMAELEGIFHQHEDTIRSAIDELVAAGVLVRGAATGHARALIWTGEILACCSKKATKRRSHTSENPSSGTSGSEQRGQLVRFPLVAEGAHCAVPSAPTITRKLIAEAWGRWREHVYALPSDDARPALTDDAWDALQRRFDWLRTKWQRAGESDESARARIVDRGVELWIKRRSGKDDFLRKAHHPLERLAQDLDWLTTELAGDPKQRAPRVHREQAPPPRQVSARGGRADGELAARAIEALAAGQRTAVGGR